MNPIIDFFKAAVDSCPPLAHEEEALLWRSIKLGKELERLPHETLTEKQKCEIRMGQQAHERIISANLRLVASLANKYQKVRGNSLDLWREGVASLERAIDKFNPSMGYGFSTYAYRLIHHCMVRLVINNRRSISKPFTIYDVVSKRNRRTSLGRRPICRQNLLEHATSKPLGSRDLCLSQPLHSPPVDLLENWIGSAPAHEDELVQMAMERTQKLRDELLKDCIPASQVAKLLNIKNPALLLRQIRARNLLAIREKGEYVFPICQFDSSAPQGVVSGLPDILVALDFPPLGIAAWLQRPHPGIDGEKPIDFMKRGETQKVLALAERAGHGQD